MDPHWQLYYAKYLYLLIGSYVTENKHLQILNVDNYISLSVDSIDLYCRINNMCIIEN